MNHMLQRILSLFLALTMVAGMLPASVFATETDDPPQETEIVTETVVEPSEEESLESPAPVPDTPEEPESESEPEPSEEPEDFAAQTAGLDMPAVVSEEGDGEGDGEEDEQSLTEEAFRTALAEASANGEAYYLTESITLTADLTIQGALEILDGGSITVPDGITLTSSCYPDDDKTEAWITVKNGGVLTIKNGAKLVIDILINIWPGGTLTVEDGASLTIPYPRNIMCSHDLSIINGIGKDQLHAFLSAVTADGLENQLARGHGEEYYCVTVSPDVDLMLDRDITIEVNDEIGLLSDNGHTLMIPDGCTLINNGYIRLESNANNKLVLAEGATLVNNGTIEIEGDAQFLCFGTLSGTGSFTGNKTTDIRDTYLTFRYLDTDENGALWEDFDAELYEVPDYGITAGDSLAVVFYRNAWDNDACQYVAEAIIPYTDNVNLTITDASDVQAIQDGQANGDCFVIVKTNGTLSHADTMLKCGEESWDYPIYDRCTGFFTSTELTVENLITDGTFYFSEGNNVFYFAALNDYVFSDIDPCTQCSHVPEAWQGVDLISVEEVEAGKLYKYTINDFFVSITHYNYYDFQFNTVTTLTRDDEYIELHFDDLWICPTTTSLVCQFFVETTDNENRCYYFYEDGSYQCGVRQVVDGEERWPILKRELPEGFSYDLDSNTLCLDSVTLFGMYLSGNMMQNGSLNVQISGATTFDYLSVFEGGSVTITGEGTLTVQDVLYVGFNSHLTVDREIPIYLARTDGLKLENGTSTFDGYVDYLSGATYISNARLESDENGNPVVVDERPLDETNTMGMQDTTRIFFKNEWDAENQEWEKTPLIPTTDDDGLTISAYEGAIPEDAQDYAGYFVTIQSHTLGGYTTTLTLGGENYTWNISPLHMGYFSSPTPSVETYLSGDNQHWFYVTEDGDNSFYLIIREVSTGITLTDFTWEFNTWNQDYSVISEDLDSNDDLIDVEDWTDDDGNHIYKVTISDAYVNYVMYSQNQKNFCLRPHATWTYNDDGNTGEMTWDMWVCPPASPADTLAPVAILNIDHNDYCFYLVGDAVKVFGNTETEDGGWFFLESTALPDGVSYDHSTNTITLENASFSNIAIWYQDSWTDNGVTYTTNRLPGKDLTLNLVGENTITSTDSNAIYIGRDVNLTITGEGSLNIQTENSFLYHEDGDASSYEMYHCIYMEGGDLVVSGSATVTTTNGHTNTVQDWLFCISMDGGTLTIRDDATVNLRLPEGYSYHDALSDETKNGGYQALCEVSAITLQDNATLNVDRLNLGDCTYTQTGGTLNAYGVSASWEDEEGNVSYEHVAIDPWNATLNISGGIVNVLPNGCPDGYAFTGLNLNNSSTLNVTGGTVNVLPDESCTEDYEFIGLNLNGGSTLNVTGGTLNISTGNANNLGILVIDNSTMRVKGGKIQLNNGMDAVTYFNAIIVTGESKFTMTGGEIETNGHIFLDAESEISGGKITVDGSCYGEEKTSYVPTVIKISGNTTISGGTFVLKEATLSNLAETTIEDGSFTITNTQQTSGSEEVNSLLNGISNNGMLTITGGTFDIDTQAAAIWNAGVFHQQGGDITATAPGIGISNCMDVWLEGGTMTLTAERGVWQYYDAKYNTVLENGSKMVSYFQVFGDHHLTIHTTKYGIAGNCGSMEFSGNATIDIELNQKDGVVDGIYLYDGSNGFYPPSLLIQDAVTLNITDPKNGSGDTPKGIYTFDVPVTISATNDGIPKITIQAATALMAEASEQGNQLFQLEGVSLADRNGKEMTNWEEIWSDTTGDSTWLYILKDENETENYGTARYVTTRQVSGAEAHFCINDVNYYINEAGAVRTDDEEEATLPRGVAYDYETNTLTLSDGLKLTTLYCNYFIEWDDEETGEHHVGFLLPNADLTIQLEGKVTATNMYLNGGINATLSGSGCLILNQYNGLDTSSLTLASGTSMTIADGQFYTYNSRFTAEDGSTLTNNGQLYIDGEKGYLDMQGSFNADGDYYVGWPARENFSGIDISCMTLEASIWRDTDDVPVMDVLTYEDLAKYRDVIIYGKTDAITEDVTIPANTLYVVDVTTERDELTDEILKWHNNTLTIDEGVTVEVYGILTTLYIYEGNDLSDISKIDNKGTLKLMEGSTSCLSAENFSGNAPINLGGTIVPTVGKVTVKATATTIDLLKDSDVKLTVTTTAKDKTDLLSPLSRVTWTSSNEEIISPEDIVDNEDGTYTVNFDRENITTLGKVTLTATAIDGSGKTAKITLTTTYNKGKKLDATLSETLHTSGLQVEEDQVMTVTLGGEDIPVSMLTLKTSNKNVATVEEVDGEIVITGVKAGTAKITATLTGDSRSVSKTVKVIAKQKENITFYEVQENGYYELEELELDLRALTDTESRTIQLEVHADYHNEWDVLTKASEYKWTTSDSSLAKVKTNSDGTATVTIQKGAYGTCVITATANDLNKATATLVITVKDYTPRLTNSKITLNPSQTTGVALELVGSYGNEITDVTVDEKLEGKVKVEWDEETEQWFLRPDDNCPTKGTLKGNLVFETDMDDDDYEPFTIPVTITLKNSLPKVTVSQTYKMDLAYTYSNPRLTFTVNGAEINYVKQDLDYSSDILLEYNEQRDRYSLALSEDCGSKINTKIKLLVYLEGYGDNYVEVTYTVKTTTTKLKVTSYPTSSTINTKLVNSDYFEVSFDIMDSAWGYLWLNPTGSEDEYGATITQMKLGSITLTEGEDPDADAYWYVPNDENRQVHVLFSREAYPNGVSGTLTMTVENSEWTKSQTVTHKISKVTTAPSVTLGSSTLTLRRSFADVPAYTTVALNQSNVELYNIGEFTCTNAQGKLLNVYYSAEDGYIYAEFDPENMPKNGTYTFTAPAYYRNADGEGTKLSKSVSIKVKVVSTEPTIKLSASTIKLNKKLAGKESSAVYPNITWETMYFYDAVLSVVGYELNGNKYYFSDEYDWKVDSYEETEESVFTDDHIKLFFSGYDCQISASLLDDSAAKTTYTLYPIVQDYAGYWDEENEEWVETGKQYTLSTALKLTVQPYSATPSVTVSSTGKLDALVPDSGITYTMKKVTNAVCDNAEVSLKNVEQDEDGNDMFLLEPAGYYTVDGEIVKYDWSSFTLKLNPDYAPGYTANKTYKVTMVYNVCGYEVEKTVSVKVNQSTAKFSAPAVTYYLAQTSDAKVNISLTSPAGATIGDVSVNEKSTSKELLKALDLEDLADAIDPENPQATATLEIPVDDPTALKAGKSYTLCLNVTPNSLATAKATTLKVTIKVQK